MNIAEQYGIGGAGASEVAASVEEAIRQGRLRPGDALPTVRRLARALRLSPATVAAAYAALRSRGLVNAQGRRGTRVSHRPPLLTPALPPVPAHLRNLAYGNPDPALLPPLRPVLSRLDPVPRLYGEGGNRALLLDLAARQLAADGIPSGPIAVVGGALDGIERVLQAHLRPGDRVAVEDPGYAAVLDLVGALGLVADPMGVDDSGPIPRDLSRALEAGVAAVILTPRAQNPTGAALDERRVAELHHVLDGRPEALVIEDDHAGPVSGAPARTVCTGRERWAVVRSVSKSLGPDLRLAILAGDPRTVSRVEGRQALGTGWVSHLLQQATENLWRDRATAKLLRRAAATYTARREGFVRALEARGVAAHGRSGMNVWIPVPEETSIVAALAEAGWGVRAGERFRLKSAPAIRVTVAALEAAAAERLAEDVARCLRPVSRVRIA